MLHCVYRRHLIYIKIIQWLYRVDLSDIRLIRMWFIEGLLYLCFCVLYLFSFPCCCSPYCLAEQSLIWLTKAMQMHRPPYYDWLFNFLSCTVCTVTMAWCHFCTEWGFPPFIVFPCLWQLFYNNLIHSIVTLFSNLCCGPWPLCASFSLFSALEDCAWEREVSPLWQMVPAVSLGTLPLLLSHNL